MALNAWYRQLAVTGHLPVEAQPTLWDDFSSLSSRMVVEPQRRITRPPLVRRPLATTYRTPLAAPATVLRAGNDEHPVVHPFVSRMRRAHTLPTAAERPALPPSKTSPSSPVLTTQQQPEARSSAPITIPQPPAPVPQQWPELTPPTTSEPSDGAGLASSVSKPSATDKTSDEGWPQVPLGPTSKGPLMMTNSVEEQILAQHKDDSIIVDALTYPLPFPFNKQVSCERPEQIHEKDLGGCETPRHQLTSLGDASPAGEPGWTPNNIRHWRTAISSPRCNEAPLPVSAGDSPWEMTTPMSLNRDKNRPSPVVVASSPGSESERGEVGLLPSHEGETELVKELSPIKPIAPSHIFSANIDYDSRENKTPSTPLRAANQLADSQRSMVSPQELDKALRNVLRRYGRSKRHGLAAQSDLRSALALDTDYSVAMSSNDGETGSGDAWASAVQGYRRGPKWRRATSLVDRRVEIPLPSDSDTDDPNRGVVAIRLKSRKRSSKSSNLTPAHSQGVSTRGTISPAANDFSSFASRTENDSAPLAPCDAKSPPLSRQRPTSHRSANQESMLSRNRPSLDLAEMGKKMSVMHSAQFAFTPLESAAPACQDSLSASTQPNSPFLVCPDGEISSDEDGAAFELGIGRIDSTKVGEPSARVLPQDPVTDEARTREGSEPTTVKADGQVSPTNCPSDLITTQRPNGLPAFFSSTNDASAAQVASPTDSMWTDVSTATSEEAEGASSPSASKQAILKPLDIPVVIIPLLLAYFWLWLCLLKTTFDVLLRFAR